MEVSAGMLAPSAKVQKVVAAKQPLPKKPLRVGVQLPPAPAPPVAAVPPKTSGAAGGTKRPLRSPPMRVVASGVISSASSCVAVVEGYASPTIEDSDYDSASPTPEQKAKAALGPKPPLNAPRSHLHHPPQEGLPPPPPAPPASSPRPPAKQMPSSSSSSNRCGGEAIHDDPPPPPPPAMEHPAPPLPPPLLAQVDAGVWDSAPDELQDQDWEENEEEDNFPPPPSKRDCR
jgi:hypothetical protein